MARTRGVNYLNNYELLQEIHKSKLTYFDTDDSKYNHFDAIVYDLGVLTDENTEEFFHEVKLSKIKKAKKDDPTNILNYDDIDIEDLVFRFMTYDHIPEDPEWPEEKVKKKASDGYMKVCFPPFQHFVFDDGVLKCVGLSHYKDGVFSPESGKITEKLGMMYMLLVEKISKKSSFRHYTYIDEMKSEALYQLSKVGLQFDEGRGQIPNPFAFYTTVVTNVFKRVLNTEKRNRDIRDDLIEMAGQNPSFTRQMDDSGFVGADYYSTPAEAELYNTRKTIKKVKPKNKKK